MQKRSTAILLFVTLTSPNDSYDSLYLANYATINLRDELSRLPGVGNVNVFGAGQYSMRVWLDPEKLKARSLNAQDVVTALQQQSQDVTAGQVGTPPTPPGVDFQYTIELQGRLSEVEQYENVIVKTGNNGEVTRLRDVGHVELGAQTYSQYFSLDGKQAAGIGIYQSPGANALEVEHQVKAKMAELAKAFPQGLVYTIPFDTTVFVNASIHEVYKTLIEAAVLVLIVILVFLQDWRAMLVPATTVPVTIVGAFAMMWAMGFTVNFSTLFAIVLSIGIVVDDAIVVVEGAAHNVEAGMSGHDAAIKAMNELLGPIIGITLVLMSVFLPAAFLPGLTGRMYAQFALVIAATALLSAVNAVTLKPTQSAMWLRPPVPPERRNAFYRGFNAVYGRLERNYAGLIHHMVEHAGIMTIVAFAIIGLAVWGLSRVPTGFLPIEDQGYLLVSVQLPDGASLARTQQAMQQVATIARKDASVAQVISIAGISVLDNSATLANAGVAYVVLKDWSERANLQTLFPRLSRALDAVDARVVVLPPPPIQGIGNAGGFTMQIELRDGSTDFAKLQSITNTVVANAQSQSALQRVSTSFRAVAPQILVEVDRVKAQTLHVPVDQVFSTLATYFGSTYVSQFNKFGRVFQVYAQADAQFRLRPRDIENLSVRNAQGDMIPLGTMVKIQPIVGPPLISLYNLYPSSSVIGLPAAGFSFRRGDPPDGAERGGDAAARHRHRMDRDVVSGEDRRQSDVFRLRDGDAAGLSGARRPIRELVRAARGHPLGAAGADRAGAGAGNAAHRQQSLHPDRHHSAHRAVRQERHSDRRSGARAPRQRRQADPRSGGRRRARPVPADPDDVVCLHSRRRAARGRQRRRRQRPQIDRHHRVLRHDRLDLPRGAVRSVAVRGDSAVRGMARRAQGAAHPAGGIAMLLAHDLAENPLPLFRIMP